MLDDTLKELLDDLPAGWTEAIVRLTPEPRATDVLREALGSFARPIEGEDSLRLRIHGGTREWITRTLRDACRAVNADWKDRGCGSFVLEAIKSPDSRGLSALRGDHHELAFHPLRTLPDGQYAVGAGF